jgi:hypothetical protein
MTYLARLHEAHHIEVSGEAVYAVAARRARTQDWREKWRALEKLEIQTKTRVAAAITGLGHTAKVRRVDVWLGHTVGGLIAVLPSRMQLRTMRAIVVHAISFWERLQRAHPEGDARLLAYLVAHERAQLDFAQDELDGRGDRSLSHVTKLLES